MATILDVKGIPVFDLGTVLAGAYVGYNNSIGVDIGSIDEVLKYGPTIAATTITPIAMLIGKMGGEYAISRAREEGFGDLPGRNIADFTIRNSLSYNNIGKETVKTSIKTALESLLGYGVGYAFGKFS